MKKKHWFKPKAFTHLTKKLSYNDAAWIESYVSNRENIMKHSFYPLIHRTIAVKRLRRSKNKNGDEVKKHYTINDGKRQSNVKYREIYYANHLDSHVYSYYTQKILEPKYEDELKKNFTLDESIIAYRRIPVKDGSRCKCNIDFADEVFEKIASFKGETMVLAIDITKFFDSIDHKILKAAWAKLLGRRDLEKDHYNIYKNVTNFSFVNLTDLITEFGFKHPNQIIQKDISYFVENGLVFRNRIKAKGYLKRNTFRKESNGKKVTVGIPQGTPISAFLANLYLLDFDKEMVSYLSSKGSIYRRYSDDILIICPKREYALIEREILQLIARYELVVQQSKTQRSLFVDGKLAKGEKPVSYLGFDYDGKRKRLKSASLSKFYRKMKNAIRFRACRALQARWKFERGIRVDEYLHRKKLYQQFSFLGVSRTKGKKRNFHAYAYFASEIMKSNSITSQLSNAWKILHNEIDRYESKYKLQRIKTISSNKLEEKYDGR
jgi:hypothetical protein